MAGGDNYITDDQLIDMFAKVVRDRSFWKKEHERLLTQYNQKWGDEQATRARSEKAIALSE